MIRDKISLNGTWDWFLPGGEKQNISVPSSYLCVGEAIFEKTIELNKKEGKNIFLVFEGITYEAEVCINGVNIGSMLPYVRYKFDVTGHILEGCNTVRVNLKDITARYGPTEGWESYGGIIRDTYLEITNKVYVEDYQWIVRFSDNYKIAACTLKTCIQNPTGGEFTGGVGFNLLYDGNEVFAGSRNIKTDKLSDNVCFEFEIVNPLLWSPQFPNLYDLEICLLDGGHPVDDTGQKVGFKEFNKNGTKFYLNGQKIIIKGVCRHDMWGDNQGFTLTREQMEQDMLMIKQTGANYVRLVHYPHHHEIVKIADRIGLMVSEEPGLWFSDLGSDVVADAALEVMRRTIIRDRNNASVIFWLAFNECIFNDKYLSNVKKLCYGLDPTRLVSGANFMNPEWTKEVFSRLDIDFYTFHPYGHYPDNFVTGGYDGKNSNISLRDVLETLSDRPVLFSEWGGWPVYENPALFKNFLTTMLDFAGKDFPEPNLAGVCFWEWADMLQTSRGYPACIDGILAEGLVDIWRNKRTNYYVLSDLFSEMGYEKANKPNIKFVNSIPSNDHKAVYKPLDLSALMSPEQLEEAWKNALDKAENENRRNSRKNKLRGPYMEKEITEIDRIPVKIAQGRPLLLTVKNRKLQVDVGFAASKVYFFGNVTFEAGYPVWGKLGDEIAIYRFIYSDGTREEITLKNGLDMTASNLVWGPSRINPSAPNVRRIMEIVMDLDWEVNAVNCFTAETDAEKILDRIEFELQNKEYTPLLYGINVRQ